MDILQEKIKDIENEILSIDMEIEKVSIKYAEEFAEKLKTHPYAEEIIIFNKNKDIIAENISRSVYENFNFEFDSESALEELKLFLFAFEYSLLFYENTAEITENIEVAVGDDAENISYILKCLPMLFNEKMNNNIHKSKNNSENWEIFLDYSVVNALQILNKINKK